MTLRTEQQLTFNSPLETGIRLVILLRAAYPKTYDFRRLVALDYLVTHTGDIQGPPNLHPSVPMRAAETLVRRRLIERSILLMKTRELIEQTTTAQEVSYCAGEMANTFIEALSSEYLTELGRRALWLEEKFGNLDEEVFWKIFTGHLQNSWNPRPEKTAK